MDAMRGEAVVVRLCCGELFSLPARKLPALTYAHCTQRHARFTRPLRHPRGNPPPTSPQLLPTPHPH